MRVEISDLPPRACQRDYVDEFFENQRQGKETRINGQLVSGAGYGHCADYPKGFWVDVEQPARSVFGFLAGARRITS